MKKTSLQLFVERNDGDANVIFWISTVVRAKTAWQLMSVGRVIPPEKIIWPGIHAEGVIKLYIHLYIRSHTYNISVYIEGGRIFFLIFLPTVRRRRRRKRKANSRVSGFPRATIPTVCVIACSPNACICMYVCVCLCLCIFVWVCFLLLSFHRLFPPLFLLSHLLRVSCSTVLRRVYKNKQV